jgi:hypothetical protein
VPWGPAAPLVPCEGAVATGAGATGREAVLSAGTIVVIVPFTAFFCFVPIVCRAARVAARFAAAAVQTPRRRLIEDDGPGVVDLPSAKALVMTSTPSVTRAHRAAGRPGLSQAPHEHDAKRCQPKSGESDLHDLSICVNISS